MRRPLPFYIGKTSLKRCVLSSTRNVLKHIEDVRKLEKKIISGKYFFK